MKLKIISSNSSGNCYLLENETEALIIECGVKFSWIKQALKFNLNKVVGCLVSHEHKDHCCSVRDVLTAGINVYASAGTIKGFQLKSHRLNTMLVGHTYQIGNFKVLTFDLQHDCAEPIGFLINHPETGNVLFATDTYYLKNTFRGLNNLILEANYSQKILDEKLAQGVTPDFLRNRVLQSHMSLDTCLEVLAANDLSAVNNIVLIHLSDSNSNAAEFKHAVRTQTRKSVHVAEKGMVIDFNKHPF